MGRSRFRNIIGGITLEKMHMVTCHYTDKFISIVDRVVDSGIFPNRSEALRFLTMFGLLQTGLINLNDELLTEKSKLVAETLNIVKKSVKSTISKEFSDEKTKAILHKLGFVGLKQE